MLDKLDFIGNLGQHSKQMYLSSNQRDELALTVSFPSYCLRYHIIDEPGVLENNVLHA